MILIEKGKELKLENLLSLRKKVTQSGVNEEMAKIGKFFESNGIGKNGSVVTATFTVEISNGQPLMDLEILVPMDRKVDLPSEYKRKDIFHIVNAVYAKHRGNPDSLQNTYNAMNEYIKNNNLQQITAGYNVQVKDLLPGMSLDEMEIDVYIGVNPSIL